MQITILSATKETIPTAKGSYDKLEIAYKGEDGQVKGKKLMSFGDSATAFKALKSASAGQFFDIESEKIGDYWVWTKVNPSDGAASPPKASTSPSGGKVVGNNYETAEERAKKQVYIVRQSSITAALSFLNNKAKSVTEVIQVAKEFENYVFSTGSAPVAEKIDFEDDIPL